MDKIVLVVILNLQDALLVCRMEQNVLLVIRLRIGSKMRLLRGNVSVKILFIESKANVINVKMCLLVVKDVIVRPIA
jgi:hypothetical protein